MCIVVKSRLSGNAANETRGKILSIYMITTMAIVGAGQLIGGVDNGISIDLFLFASILVSIAVVPVLIFAT